MDPEPGSSTPFTAGVAPDAAWLTFGDYWLAVMLKSVVDFFVAVYAAPEIAVAPGDDWPEALRYFELPLHWDLPTIAIGMRVN